MLNGRSRSFRRGDPLLHLVTDEGGTFVALAAKLARIAFLHGRVAELVVSESDPGCVRATAYDEQGNFFAYVDGLRETVAELLRRTLFPV